MGSYTKGMRRQMDEIHAKIVAAHRRGVCDSEGRSMKNAHGEFIARPRHRGYVTFRKVYPRIQGE